MPSTVKTIGGRLVVKKDTVDETIAAIKDMMRVQVLVGIPEFKADRKDHDSELTNAQLGYIHEFGTAEIPARPVLIPGVQAARPQVNKFLALAVRYAMDGDREKANRALNDAGIVAVSSVKKQFYNDFTPLAESTIRNRFRSRNTAGMRDAEEYYFDLLNDGVSSADAQRIAGIRPLVNTGQYRNSFTYVIRQASNG